MNQRIKFVKMTLFWAYVVSMTRPILGLLIVIASEIITLDPNPTKEFSIWLKIKVGSDW
jgi:hypothetical protein